MTGVTYILSQRGEITAETGRQAGRKQAVAFVAAKEAERSRPKV